jgi:hypothetical protein
MQKTLALSFVIAALLAGCAVTETGDGATHEDKVYRTGSNIGRKQGQMPDGVTTATVQPGDTNSPTSVPMPRAGGR